MTLPRCARFGSPWPSAALRSTELTQHFSTSGPDDRVAGGVGRRRVRACQATRRETRRRSHHAETRHVHTRTRHVHSSVTARGHFRGFDSLARRFARLPKYLRPCPAASPPEMERESRLIDEVHAQKEPRTVNHHDDAIAVALFALTQTRRTRRRGAARRRTAGLAGLRTPNAMPRLKEDKGPHAIPCP